MVFYGVIFGFAYGNAALVSLGMCTVAVICIGVIIACVVGGSFGSIILISANFTELAVHTSCFAALMIFKDYAATVVANVVVILGGVSVCADIRLSALTVTGVVGVFVYMIVYINLAICRSTSSTNRFFGAGSSTACVTISCRRGYRSAYAANDFR
ncbi:MAG: hypothetical protein IKL79_05820 [Clostridia bacterium]|nr:hypothetical protein [Clostridia bacterium]